MSAQNTPGLTERFAALESLQAEIIRKAKPFISPSQPMHTEHLYVLGIIKRTLAQTSAFRTLIEARNFPCAAAIVRLQIDSAMRLNALRLVSDPVMFCKEWLGGKQINQMTSSKGHKLTDTYLRDQLALDHEWVTPVYKEASGFVHFSARHFFASIASIERDTHVVQFELTATDPPKPESEYFEVVDAFFEATRVVGILSISLLMALSGNANETASSEA